MKIEIEFTEPLLGTLPGNKEIAEEFIISRHPEGHAQDETDSILESVEKATTFFARDEDGMLMLWDYQVKGYFKSACEAMIMTDTLTQEELKKVRLTRYLYKKTIDMMIFVSPRRIRLENYSELIMCERPLRKDNPKGGNVALSRSEEAPAGTTIEIEIVTLNEKLNDFIKRWLDYGVLSGFGQWRNSGKGRFIWKELKSE